MGMPSIFRRLVDGEPVVGPPHPGQLDVLYQLLKPPYTKEIRMINLCCGWGFGKTYAGIDAAMALLDLGPNMNGLFLEPNVQMMLSHFLGLWRHIVPPELYTLHLKTNEIVWKRTGSKLRFEHRAITGSKANTLFKMQGYTVAWIIDDEASTACDLDLHTAMFVRIREPKAPLLARITLSTPRMGPYATLIKQPGSITIRGRSEDNPHLSREVLAQMRANMSRAQARRDMDGELVALEDQLWPRVDLDNSWPLGNIDDKHPRFSSTHPWYLFCDLGSATGAYVVAQRVDNGFLYGQPRWVIVADYCPQSSANVRDAFRKLRQQFGTPAGIVAGRDSGTRANTDGATPAYFAHKIWGNVRIYVEQEDVYNKQTQYDAADWLFCNAKEERRLTIARSMIEGMTEGKNPPGQLDPDSKRGIIQMIQQDVWPPLEERRANEYLPKGPKISVSHVRDALLMGVASVMRPPDWAGDPSEKPWHKAN